jgi:PAS domain S-box-containing protein
MSKEGIRQVDIRDFINQFGLSTIQGRILLLVFVSLFLIITFSIIITVQNRYTYRISQNVEHLEIPLALAASSLSSGLDKVTASQEAYIMSGTESFRRERVQSWEKEIEPALNIMKQLSKESNSSADRQKVQEIETLLYEFKIIQEEVDKYFVENRKAFNYEGISTDSISAIAIEMLAQYNQDRRTQQKMVEMLGNKATPIRQKIANAIKPLIENQQSLLKREVTFIQENIYKTNTTILVIGLTSIILLCWISYSLIRTVRDSIAKPVTMLNQLAVGKLDVAIHTTKDELNAVIQAGKQLSENIKQASEFAIHIGKGQFDTSFQPLGKEDVLGNSLIEMRQQLRLAAEEERKRAWSIEGMSKFVAILQSEKNSGIEIANEIISVLVTYLHANQGGIFVLNDNNHSQIYLEMLACYAYDRKKYMERKIAVKGKLAEGLIGQTFVEKQTIHLAEIPADYLQITSGLGYATPANLLLVPLKNNEKVEGVIEIASFKSFEKYEIEFIEKLAETIAITITTFKARVRNKKLLEETRLASETIKQKEATLQALINNTSDLILAIDTSYRLILCNEAYRKSVEERGFRVFDGMNVLEVIAPENRAQLSSYYQRGMSGEHFFIEEKFTIQNNEIYYELSYNPIRNETGSVIGVSIFARNITERKLQEQQLQEIVQREKERSEVQIESQRKILEQSVLLFREKEKAWIQKLANLENEVASLKN